MQLRAVPSGTEDFSSGRSDLNSGPRPGGPIGTGFVTHAAELIECESFLSQKAIAQRLGIHKKTVKRIFTMDLGPRNVNFK